MHLKQTSIKSESAFASANWVYPKYHPSIQPMSPEEHIATKMAGHHRVGVDRIRSIATQEMKPSEDESGFIGELFHQMTPIELDCFMRDLTLNVRQMARLIRFGGRCREDGVRWINQFAVRPKN